MRDTQYFIDKFEAIPEDRWTTFTQIDSQERRCALGHLLPSSYNYETWSKGWGCCGSETEEGKALCLLFSPIRFSGACTVANINNGEDDKYQQDTPKQRVLAALRDIQKREEEEKAGQPDTILALIKWEPEEDDDDKGNPFEEEPSGPYAPGAFSLKWGPEEDELEDEEPEIEIETPLEV